MSVPPPPPLANTHFDYSRKKASFIRRCLNEDDLLTDYSKSRFTGRWMYSMGCALNAVRMEMRIAGYTGAPPYGQIKDEMVLFLDNLYDTDPDIYYKVFVDPLFHTRKYFQGPNTPFSDHYDCAQAKRPQRFSMINAAGIEVWVDNLLPVVGELDKNQKLIALKASAIWPRSKAEEAVSDLKSVLKAPHQAHKAAAQAKVDEAPEAKAEDIA